MSKEIALWSILIMLIIIYLQLITMSGSLVPMLEYLNNISDMADNIDWKLGLLDYN